MIDNYDCFTYNLVQYFGELGEEVRVFRNDEITLDGIAALQPDRLVLSPGPCTPAEAGICVDGDPRTSPASCRSSACAWATRPSARRSAARSCARKRRCTARPSVHHAPTSAASTPGCREQFTVIRYHSLVIERASLPAELEITATVDDDGEIMGVRHRELAGTRRRWKACSSIPNRSSPSTATRC